MRTVANVRPTVNEHLAGSQENSGGMAQRCHWGRFEYSLCKFSILNFILIELLAILRVDNCGNEEHAKS